MLGALGLVDRVVLFPGLGGGIEYPAAGAGRIGLRRQRDRQAEREGERDEVEGVGDGAVLHYLSPCWMYVIHLGEHVLRPPSPVAAPGASSISTPACRPEAARRRQPGRPR